MPVTMRGPWLLHLVGMVALLPRDVRAVYEVPRWIPTGPLTRVSLRALLRAMNVAYLVFPPIRRARRRLDELERRR